jgi:hypothetical protein
MDAALYDEAPPSDAAFVRFLGAPGKRLDEILGYAFPRDLRTQQAYVAISKSMLDGVTAGEYLSIVQNGEGQVHTLHEPEKSDPFKVQLLLINADHEPVRLVLAGQSTEIIETTERLNLNARSVNPVSAEVVVETLEGKAMGVFNLNLRRGQDVTFFVHRGEVQMIGSTFGPVISSH